MGGEKQLRDEDKGEEGKVGVGALESLVSLNQPPSAQARSGNILEC